MKQKAVYDPGTAHDRRIFFSKREPAKEKRRLKGIDKK
jgi:hypothetical protein